MQFHFVQFNCGFCFLKIDANEIHFEFFGCLNFIWFCQNFEVLSFQFSLLHKENSHITKCVHTSQTHASESAWRWIFSFNFFSSQEFFHLKFFWEWKFFSLINFPAFKKSMKIHYPSRCDAIFQKTNFCVGKNNFKDLSEKFKEKIFLHHVATLIKFTKLSLVFITHNPSSSWKKHRMCVWALELQLWVRDSSQLQVRKFKKN